MVAPNNSEPPTPDALIERSRAAVTRGRKAVAVAQEFDNDRQARAAEMRNLREDAARLVHCLEDKVQLARKLVPSPPNGRKHD